MGILLLAAASGTLLTVSAEGEDEQAAITTLCDFIENGFGEDTCRA